jgi:hypothetical protein
MMSWIRGNFLRWLCHGLLLAGFLTLMLDIRYEHRQVVGEEPVAWTPIFFSLSMLLAIPLGVLLWRNGGKFLLVFSYTGSIVVGALGLYFHSNGQWMTRLQDIFSVWQSWITKIDTTVPVNPPLLAPLSFCGLGAIGLLFLYLEKSQFFKE